MTSNINSQSFLSAIFNEFKKIGTCSYEIIDRPKCDGANLLALPDSWFYSRKRGTIKPYLKINGLESFDQRAQGNGRLCLQALFELALRYGCDGRMLVEAKFGSAGFYEACGFQGKRLKEDGIKFFDPTQKNIKLLYKGCTEKTTFKFIPLSTIDSEKEKNSYTNAKLFNQMLQKAKQK